MFPVTTNESSEDNYKSLHHSAAAYIPPKSILISVIDSEMGSKIVLGME